VEYTNIKLERENRVATIRLNRPDSLNALSPELIAELSSAVAEVHGDEDVKALVVRGEGRAFCSGADLTYLETAFDVPDQLSVTIQRMNECLFQLEELPVPVIAVVHGFALAGGLELMLACDMAVAADDADALLGKLRQNGVDSAALIGEVIRENPGQLLIKP